ncbi:MAG: aminotransferase class I/II-fold pyridoxal phosphate-dependent enzyme, partial [Longimicrobiales bacterium]
ELMAQAEHDPDAAAVLVSTEVRHIVNVPERMRYDIPELNRREIIAASLAARGAILYAETLDEALAFAERFAPEHLLLMIEDPRAALPRVRSAGTVFLGAHSSVTFGDYITGANHVLPTAGLARAHSGLSTLDFIRWTTIQEVSPEAAAILAPTATLLAGAEGLQAHAIASVLHLRPPDATKTEQVGALPEEVAATTSPLPVRMRASYEAIRPYEPGRVPTPIDLSDNTNLFGVPPAVGAVLATLSGPTVTRYPSVYATGLKGALARLHGVAPENVVTGCGSDDVIDSAIRAFLEPGEAVAYPWPTFGVVPLFARMNAAEPAAVPLGNGFALDAATLLEPRAAVTYLCRPNNPTGTAFDRDEVARVLREAAGVVLIDEAYADFADDDVLDLVLASNRAVALRTLSKAYGLAGLRIGYAIGPAPIIAEIEKSRGPYKVSGPAEAAAIAVLEQDMAWVRDGISQVRENRGRLDRSVRGSGLLTWPSAANFLLVQLPPWAGSAQAFGTALRARGVAVRAFPALPGAGDCIRVTVGPWEMMERLVAALDGACEEVSVTARRKG